MANVTKNARIIAVALSKDPKRHTMKCAKMMFSTMDKSLSGAYYDSQYKIYFAEEIAQVGSVKDIKTLFESRTIRKYNHVVFLVDRSMLEPDPDNQNASLISTILDMAKEYLKGYSDIEILFNYSVIFCHTDTFTDDDNNTLSKLCKEYGLMYDEFILSKDGEKVIAAPTALMVAIAAGTFFDEVYRFNFDYYVYVLESLEEKDVAAFSVFDYMLFTIGAAEFSDNYYAKGLTFKHLYLIPEYLKDTLSPQNNSYEEILVKSPVTRPLVLHAAKKGIERAYDILFEAKCRDTDYIITLGKYGTAEQIWDHILNNSYMNTDIEISEIPFSCIYLELMLMLRFDKDQLHSVVRDREGQAKILHQIFLFEAEIYFSLFMRDKNISTDCFEKIKWFCDDPDLAADKTANMLNNKSGGEVYWPERSALFRLSPRKKTKPDYDKCYELACVLQERQSSHADDPKKHFSLILGLYNIVCESSPDDDKFEHVLTALEDHVKIVGQPVNPDDHPHIFSCEAAKRSPRLKEEYSRLTGRKQEESNE